MKEDENGEQTIAPSFFYQKSGWDFVFFELKEWDVVENPAEHLVGPGAVFGTIQEDSTLELESKSTKEFQLKEWVEPV